MAMKWKAVLFESTKHAPKKIALPKVPTGRTYYFNEF
jgi:hypothetical protein